MTLTELRQWVIDATEDEPEVRGELLELLEDPHDPEHKYDSKTGWCPDVPMVEKDFSYEALAASATPFWSILSPNENEDICFFIDAHALKRLRDQIDRELGEWIVRTARSQPEYMAEVLTQVPPSKKGSD